VSEDDEGCKSFEIQESLGLKSMPAIYKYLISDQPDKI